jgi:minor histocompatibility antigen H13
MIPSALYVLYYGPNKPILLTNLLALSFGHGAMSMLKLDSFKTGSILLSGLFFYDIWWVFGTKVVCGYLSFRIQ